MEEHLPSMYKVPIASPVLEKKIIFLTLVIDDKEHLMKGLLESGRRNGGGGGGRRDWAQVQIQ